MESARRMKLPMIRSRLTLLRLRGSWTSVLNDRAELATSAHRAQPGRRGGDGQDHGQGQADANQFADHLAPQRILRAQITTPQVRDGGQSS